MQFSVDWSAMATASLAGEFRAYLEHHVPRAHWHAVDERGCTLLHHACMTPDDAAVVMLLRSGLTVDPVNSAGWTPLHVSAARSSARSVEALCAAGADANLLCGNGQRAIDLALAAESFECVAALVANGVRLRTATARARITPDMASFEYGVVHCRAVVVALLGVKRYRGHHLRHVDRFLIRELARSVWVTRTAYAWRAALVESDEYWRQLQAWSLRA